MKGVFKGIKLQDFTLLCSQSDGLKAHLRQ